jgi:hypothetical protein
MYSISTYLPYIIIGLGVGYLLSLGVTGGPSDLEYRKQDLESKKERLRRLSGIKRSS